METFNEFQPQSNIPERSSGSIISHAFEMYKGVFLYALVAIIIYAVAASVIQGFSGFDSRSFSEEIRSGGGDFSAGNIWDIPGMRLYTGLSSLVGLLAAPLFVGVIYIANEYNNAEKIKFSDLFIGYRQNTLNIILYSLISNIILVIAAMLCIVPVFLVMPFLLLGYPILLFENATFSEALSKSFAIAKANYGVLLGTALLGMLISISGIILCGIGIFLTVLFYMVVTYSAYCAFVGKPRVLVAS